LYSNTTGDLRTGIGYTANSVGAAYDNSTGLGYNADCSAANQVRIGNSGVTSIGGYEPWTDLSDSQFKRNIKEDVKGLEFIVRLRPVTYTIDQHVIEDFFEDHYGERDTSYWPSKYDASKLVRTGFIAQEVESAAQAVGYDFFGVDKPKNEDDFYGLRYGVFVVPLVKAVQEQQILIETLQEKNALLESQMNKLMTVLEDTGIRMNQD
jgi:hypothetical protein